MQSEVLRDHDRAHADGGPLEIVIEGRDRISVRFQAQAVQEWEKMIVRLRLESANAPK